MDARAFNRRIKIYSLSEVSDGFGGKTMSKVFLRNTWAAIKGISEASASRLADLGMTNLDSTLKFVLRKRNDLDLNRTDLYIEYKDQRYDIQSRSENDINDRYITLIATKQKVNNTILVLDGSAFPYTFPLTLS